MASMRNLWMFPLTLAACSASPPERSPESDAAVERGSAPAPVPTTSSAVADVPPPVDALPRATTALTPAAPATTANSLEEGPEQSADAARRLVRRYYALIGRGDYAGAYALWDDRGRAAGMTQAAFAQSFARYARYEAAVGRPGRIEAGAGQRYVTVPVTLTGTSGSGEPFARRGAVVLHRAGPIDGATAEQRRWRIARIDAAGAPVDATPVTTPSPTASPIRTARYRCGDGSLMLVRFDQARDAADVELGGSLLGTLEGQRPAPGIWYSRGDIALRGKGDEATLSRPDTPELSCRAER